MLFYGVLGTVYTNGRLVYMDKNSDIQKEIDATTKKLHEELRGTYLCKILACCDDLWPRKADDLDRHTQVLHRFARSLVSDIHFTSYEPALIYFYMVSSTAVLFGYLFAKMMFGFHWFLLIPAVMYILLSVLRVFYILFRDYVLNLQIKVLRDLALQDCGTDKTKRNFVAKTMTLAVFTVAMSIRVGGTHGKKNP